MAKKERRSSRSGGRGGRGWTGVDVESKSRGGGREPSRVLLAELITKMEDECETELQLSFAKLDIECDRKLDAWRGKMLTQRARAAKRLRVVAARRTSLKRELVALDHERHALEAKVSTLKTQTSKKALARMRKALAVECSARKDAAKEEFMQRRLRVVLERYEEEDEEKEERSDGDSGTRVGSQRWKRGSRCSGAAHDVVTSADTASDDEALPRSVGASDGGDEESDGDAGGVFSANAEADEETLLGEEDEEDEEDRDGEEEEEEEEEEEGQGRAGYEEDEGGSVDSFDASAFGGDETTVEDSAVAFSSSGEEAAVATSEEDVGEDDDTRSSEEGTRDEKQLEETAAAEQAASESKRKRSSDASVSCILCTVTFHANRAHNLTRSP
jgi:hypothetical protein